MMMDSIKDHVAMMDSMTCSEKTRYVLEHILCQKRPLNKIRYWNKVYQFFYREMHYQKYLANSRRYNARRKLIKTGIALIPCERRRIPSGFNSQSEFRRYVAAGMRHLCTAERIITRHEAFRAGLTVHIGAENRKYDKIPSFFR